MSIEILLSILAAFFVGTSDFLAKLRPNNRHVINSLFMMSLMGMIFFGSYGLIKSENILTFVDFKTTSMLALSGIANIMALYFLYVGLQRGPVSVVAPLVSLSTVFLAFKWFLMGITLTTWGYLGGIIAIVGAYLLSIKRKNDDFSHRHILITALLGGAAGFFFSLRLFIMQLISMDIDHSIVLFQSRFFGFISVVLVLLYYASCKVYLLPKRHEISLRNDIAIPTLQAFLGAVGIILLLIASVGKYAVIAPTIFSVNAAFTVLWSVWYFKEKLNAIRILGFIVILIGITLLKVSS